MKKVLLLLLCVCSFYNYGQQDATSVDPNFTAFELDSLVTQLEQTGKPWLPIMNGKNILTGLYMLKKGAIDKQSPHDTDEVYYVASGKGKFKADGQEVIFREGSILFVKAEVEHSFFDITEDAVLVVFFDQ